MRLAFRFAEGVAGYVEARREQDAGRNGQDAKELLFRGKVGLIRSNDRFGFIRERESLLLSENAVVLQVATQYY